VVSKTRVSETRSDSSLLPSPAALRNDPFASKAASKPIVSKLGGTVGF
jgi:hypothetical protein